MEFLSDTYIVFFVVIAIGIAIGKIKIKGISLDISAIIFVALVFGHFGIKMPAIFQKIGLIFFIYSIGIQAGPGFFMAFKSHGIVLLKLSLLVMTTGGVTAWILASFFNIEPELAVQPQSNVQPQPNTQPKPNTSAVPTVQKVKQPENLAV